MKVKTINKTSQSKLLTTSLFLLAAITSHAGSNYEMKKFVIAGGETIKNGGYVMNSAIGQNVTTRSTSSSYQMTAGFYQENRDLIFLSQFDSNNNNF